MEERPPGSRRRLDGDAMIERDAEVARLRRQNVPFRVIAKRLKMSLSQVQAALTRTTAARMARMDRPERQPGSRPDYW
jgi:DNA-binding CsgD family transcriptional regulator